MTKANLLFAGAILAGGRSLRFGGQPKGLLQRGPGQTMIAYLLAEMRAVGIDRIVLLANDLDLYHGCGCPVVPDLRPGLGPLAGIEAALDNFKPEHIDGLVILPCDMPAISREQILTLRKAFCRDPGHVAMATSSRDQQRAHPLCSILPPLILPQVRSSLDRDQRTVRRLWRDLDANPVVFADDAPFINVNSRDDWDQWVRGLS